MSETLNANSPVGKRPFSNMPKMKLPQVLEN
jgi:hypothetical protein